MRDAATPHDERRAILVEVGDCPDEDGVDRTRPALARAGKDPGSAVLYLDGPRPSGDRVGKVASSFGEVHGIIDKRETSAWSRILSALEAEGIRKVAFSPASAALDQPDWRDIPVHEPALRIWLPRLEWPSATACEHDPGAVGWIASTALIGLMREHGIGLSFRASEVVSSLLASSIEPLWISSGSAATRSSSPTGRPTLNRDARVLAIIPHHRCETWLSHCVRSLTTQTRPPDSIVVIDDASAEPPRDIVARHPGVTLLRARENVGPYRLVQTVIDATDYDAYLFQDADDWSTRDRLELLLEAATDSGAELIGTQELRLHAETGRIDPVSYPLDVNRALSERAGHPLLHPTSLASRGLIRRIGGFASGLRFGGDTEFLWRAGHAGRIVNIPRFCYVRRLRPFSLTTDPATGFGSAARLRLRAELRRRAERNRAETIRGRPPDLAPCRTAPPVAVDHILGPDLRTGLLASGAAR